MRYEISEDEAKKARSPHELFLINLIFNHVFLLIAALMATSLSEIVVIVPILSAGIVAYTLWRAKRSLERDPWFVICHWQIAARRSRFFAIIWVIAGAVILGLWLISGGDLKPGHYAVGGLFGLPVMATMLVLILMESEAMQQASDGTLPQSVADRFPRHEWSASETQGPGTEPASESAS